MKSHITVIINSSVDNIKTALTNALEPHRLNEDDLDSIENHHWDYWIFPDGRNLIDAEVQNRFPELDTEILKNASL